MTKALRLLAVSLALAAMMLRGLLPAGWMPDTSAHGAVIVLCTTDGMVKVVLDTDGKPVRPGEHQRQNQDSCPFAAAPHLAAAAPPPSVPPPDMRHAALSFIASVAPPRAPAHSHASPRAPPFSA